MKKLKLIALTIETIVTCYVGEEEDTMIKNVSSTVEDVYNELNSCMDAGDSKSPFYKRKYYSDYDETDMEPFIRYMNPFLRYNIENFKNEFFIDYENYKRRRKEYEEQRKEQELKQKKEQEELERRWGLPPLTMEDLLKSLLTSDAARLNEEAYGKPCNYNEDEDT